MKNGLSGSEVFSVNGDNWSRQVDKLLVNKLSNAQTCFNYRRNNSTNSTRNRTQFADDKLINAISDIQTNPASYNIDFRLGMALNLRVRPYGNASDISLMDVLSQDLYARNGSFFFACENGNCVYQTRGSGNQTSQTFALYQSSSNNTVAANVSSNANITTQPTQRQSSNLRSKRQTQSGKKQSENTIKISPALAGYLSSSLYPSSTFITNQQIGIRFNMYNQLLQNNLGNASSVIGLRNSTRNFTGLSIFTTRPSYYSLYKKGANFVPSWGLYKSYYLALYSFDIFRSTYNGTRVVSAPRPGKGLQLPANHGNQTLSNGSQVPPPKTNGTQSNGTQGNQTQSNATQANATRPANKSVSFISLRSRKAILVNQTNSASGAQVNVTPSLNKTQTNGTQGNQTGNTSQTNGTQGNGTKNHTHNHTKHNGTHGNQNGNNSQTNGTQGNHTGNTSQTNGTQGNHTGHHGNKTHNYTDNKTENSNGTQGNQTGKQSHYLKDTNKTKNGSRPKKNFTGKSGQNKTNANLKPSFNPLDWVPSYRIPFNITDYMNTINQKLNQIKIYVECCNLFCVTFIESFDDDLTAQGNAKRVFVDFNLRNYYTLDASRLDADKKGCMLGDLYYASSSSNWVKDCNIDAPFTTLPVKNSCRNQLNNQCASLGFNQIADRFSGKCDHELLCVNVTDNSTEADRLLCGAAISSRFAPDSLRVQYSSLINPCNNAPAPAPSRLNSLIQTHFLKKVAFIQTAQNTTSNSTANATSNTTSNATSNTTTNATASSNGTSASANATASSNGTTASANATASNTTSSNTTSSSNSSQYVNETALTPSEVNDMNSTRNAAGGITLAVNIDNNTNLAPNTNVEADMKIIAGNNTNTSTTSGFFIKISGLFVILFALFI
jgi:hypothetical protein